MQPEHYKCPNLHPRLIDLNYLPSLAGLAPIDTCPSVSMSPRCTASGTGADGLNSLSATQLSNGSYFCIPAESTRSSRTSQNSPGISTREALSIAHLYSLTVS